MGIIDKVSSILPWRSERRETNRGDVLALRDELDRWFDRFMKESWDPQGVAERWVPGVEVEETDHEVVVTVEVPGLDPDELHVSTSGRQLVVRGERAEERGGERRYEAFVRTVPLPPGLDLEDAEARVRNGVLTVRFLKAAARDGSRRIPVRT
jgi:HSP20 family protein